MRSVGSILVTAVLIAVGVSPAGAHVTVDPGEAERGSFAKLAFRVPNERDDAGTTQLEIVFPEGHGLRSVSVRPNDPWTVTVDRAGGESVQRIVWTGGRIAPGQFEEFEISVGPLPGTGEQLVFRALQTYDSGEVVRWIDEPAADGAEPEHPAPVLALVAGDDTDDATEGDDGEEDDPATAAAGEDEGDDDDAGTVVAWVALAVAAAALAAALTGRRRRVV